MKGVGIRRKRRKDNIRSRRGRKRDEGKRRMRRKRTRKRRKEMGDKELDGDEPMAHYFNPLKFFCLIGSEPSKMRKFQTNRYIGSCLIR